MMSQCVTVYLISLGVELQVLVLGNNLLYRQLDDYMTCLFDVKYRGQVIVMW